MKATFDSKPLCVLNDGLAVNRVLFWHLAYSNNGLQSKSLKHSQSKWRKLILAPDSPKAGMNRQYEGEE
jgi:hypothetical protein